MTVYTTSSQDKSAALLSMCIKVHTGKAKKEIQTFWITPKPTGSHTMLPKHSSTFISQM